MDSAIVAVLVSIFVAFILGVILPLLVGRGLFGKFIAAFISGKLLVRVHLNRGGAVFRLAVPVKGSLIYAFNLFGKSDVRFFSVVAGSVVRAARVGWVDVSESDTSPFIFDRIIPFSQEFDVEKKDDDGKVVLDADGKPVLERVSRVAYKKFVGYDDSPIIRQLMNWALLRPRRKLVGGLNPFVIVGIVVIIIVVVLIVSQIGGAAQAANTIG